jgi:hopene-associated glycosyltransferase HpnB
MRPEPPPAGPGGAVVVAVVPARDEAPFIGRALASLLAQDYPGLAHIVVVDDESGDGTAGVARVAAEAVGAGRRVTVRAGRPPPPGWTGKLWALHQGIETARRLRPDFLLLTDADIVHAPGNLRELLGRSREGGFDLVSLMVRLRCRNLWERLLIPAFVFFFLLLYPPRWVADRSRRTAAAAGGCILIRARTLDRIGGVAAIRHEIIDDCALARRVKAVGKVWLGLSPDTKSIRDYGSLRQIWDMVVRSAFAQLGYRTVMLIPTLALLTTACIAPPLLLLSGSPIAMLLGGVAWLAMSGAFLPCTRRYGRPPATALLLPAISLFYAAATLASAALHRRGRGGAWKGRLQALAASRRAGERDRPRRRDADRRSDARRSGRGGLRLAQRRASRGQ